MKLKFRFNTLPLNGNIYNGSTMMKSFLHNKEVPDRYYIDCIRVFTGVCDGFSMWIPPSSVSYEAYVYIEKKDLIYESEDNVQI